MPVPPGAAVLLLVGHTLKFSVNGASEQVETLEHNDRNNWCGDHSTANDKKSSGR